MFELPEDVQTAQKLRSQVGGGEATHEEEVALALGAVHVLRAEEAVVDAAAAGDGADVPRNVREQVAQHPAAFFVVEVEKAVD